jgi:hypothetical protein
MGTRLGGAVQAEKSAAAGAVEIERAGPERPAGYAFRLRSSSYGGQVG